MRTCQLTFTMELKAPLLWNWPTSPVRRESENEWFLPLFGGNCYVFYKPRNHELILVGRTLVGNENFQYSLGILIHLCRITSWNVLSQVLFPGSTYPAPPQDRKPDSTLAIQQWMTAVGTLGKRNCRAEYLFFKNEYADHSLAFLSQGFRHLM